jgi:hypothetical protein
VDLAKKVDEDIFGPEAGKDDENLLFDLRSSEGATLVQV